MQEQTMNKDGLPNSEERGSGNQIVTHALNDNTKTARLILRKKIDTVNELWKNLT